MGFAVFSKRKNHAFAASVAMLYPMTIAMTVPMWSADSGTKPNTELSASRKGIVRVATATPSVDHNSSGLGLLRKAGLWVRRTSTGPMPHALQGEGPVAGLLSVRVD